MNKQKRTANYYKEGDWVVVPLDHQGYALGIIARANRISAYLLGYFFPMRYKNPPSYESTTGLTPNDAVLIAWFSDIGIKNGEWLVLHNSGQFSQAEWPVPLFGRPDLVHSDKGFLIEYNQEEPISSRPIREAICNADQLAGLPIDEKYGHLALIKKLLYLTS